MCVCVCVCVCVCGFMSLQTVFVGREIYISSAYIFSFVTGTYLPDPFGMTKM